MPEQVYALKAYTYGGLGLERGQVFTLRGLRNDEKLSKHGYLSPLTVTDTCHCDGCGKEFATEQHYRQHLSSARHDREASIEVGTQATAKRRGRPSRSPEIVEDAEDRQMASEVAEGQSPDVLPDIPQKIRLSKGGVELTMPKT
ncbi:hypothetical protein LCGC14_2129200 [marine sediment metagenome]|uniref:C2H2-type domain-containing protein n=1 Tax=marine sediment metagenome TaxID=412755 RepID=A0A0F9EP30_9ZZZZ